MSFNVKVDVSSAVAEKFGKMQQEAPKTFRNAVGRSFSVLRRNIVKAMQGGDATYIPALAPWHPYTAAVTRARKFGGKLANPSVIRVYKADDRVTAGWVSGLAGAAKAWQEDDTYALDKADRKRMHIVLSRCGVKNHSLVPMVYRRPKRDVINTLTGSTRHLLGGWIVSAYEKDLKRQLEKGWTAK